MKRVFLFLVLSVAFIVGEAQDRHRFRLVEYNVENCFDTLDTAGKGDTQFLPDGEYHWNSAHYWHKLSNLSRVILDLGGLQPVDVVALCEVESDSVLHDLTRRTRLAALGYEYVITHSPDLRGVNVALLYQPLTFRLVSHNCFRVPYNPLSERPTRDVLLCTGVLPTGDTLDVVAVHFPSRRGGERASRPYRMRAAEVVRHITDSLKSVRSHPYIAVMGDCNDTPSDASLRHIAKGGFVNLSASAVAVNGFAEPLGAWRSITGTYYFQQEWSRIDNILLSKPTIEHFGIFQSAQIFAPDYLLEADKDGFYIPYRTYRGPSYHGGVSDHLPLYLDIFY